MNIDQRLLYLTQSTESLHNSLQELHNIITAEREAEAGRWAQEHKRWSRLNGAIRAAVLEYFREDGAAE